MNDEPTSRVVGLEVSDYLSALTKLMLVPPGVTLARLHALQADPAARAPEHADRTAAMIQDFLHGAPEITGAQVLTAATQLVSLALVAVPVASRPEVVMAFALSCLLTGDIRAATIAVDRALHPAAPGASGTGDAVV